MRSRPRLVSAVGLVLLALASTTNCHDTGRRSPTPAAQSSAEAEASGSQAEPAPTATPTSPTSTPGPTGLSDATLAAVADLLCRAYGDWPRLLVDDAFATELEAEYVALTQGLSPAARDALAAAPVAGRALAECPDVLVPERLASSGLPRPQGRLQNLPGLFPAEAPPGEVESRVVLEWTAIALGCTGLSGETEARLAELQGRLLSAMGFTLDRYVEASLANADVAVSDRIFRGIHACAEREGAHVVE